MVPAEQILIFTEISLQENAQKIAKYVLNLEERQVEAQYKELLDKAKRLHQDKKSLAKITQPAL